MVEEAARGQRPGATSVRIVFMGTPAFAVPSLERVVKAGHDVIAVYTQPDRPKGRGQQDAMPPVKQAALRLGLRVEQPERVRRPEVIEELRAMAPEAIVVVGYGQILPQPILDIAPAVNLHASLLPRYRGAAPVQWAIARGETRTGVTTTRISAQLDAGDILLTWETDIGPEETAVELGARLAVAGADLLARTLAELDRIAPRPQDHSQASWAPVIKKEDGRIDWNMSATEIANRVRGFQPWPGCYGQLRGRQFHIWKARPVNADARLAPGELRVEGRRLLAGCGQGALELIEVQMEGRKRMPAAAFLNGFPLEAGEALE
jgi:methionyl-tRNA formyltransferase